jgi:hypothetical protein
MKDSGPQCRHCQYFYHTYNQQTPYGCRKFAFQSKLMPQLLIKQADAGRNCQAFKPKTLKPCKSS